MEWWSQLPPHATPSAQHLLGRPFELTLVQLAGGVARVRFGLEWMSPVQALDLLAPHIGFMCARCLELLAAPREPGEPASLQPLALPSRVFELLRVGTGARVDGQDLGAAALKLVGEPVDRIDRWAGGRVLGAVVVGLGGEVEAVAVAATAEGDVGPFAIDPSVART